MQAKENLSATQGNTFESRRHEVRDYLTKASVLWRYHRRDHWRDASLLDLSASGLALQVAEGPPSVGDEIELLLWDVGWRAFGQVVRAQLGAGQKITVACQRPLRGNGHARLRPPSHPHEARRNLAELIFFPNPSNRLRPRRHVAPDEPGRAIVTINPAFKN